LLSAIVYSSVNLVTALYKVIIIFVLWC